MNQPRNHSGRARIGPPAPAGKLPDDAPPGKAPVPVIRLSASEPPTLGYRRRPPLPDQDLALGELSWVVWAVVGVFLLALFLAVIGAAVNHF